MFVKTDDENNIITYPYTIEIFRNENKNVSFPLAISNSLLASYSVYPVEYEEKPEHNKITQYVYPADIPTYIEGTWKLSWLIGEKDENWIANELEQEKTRVRSIRDSLLLKSDWVTIKAYDANVPVSSDWAEYRQILRDVTSQEGFPWNVIWPTDPSGYQHSD
jgi:hypothetical protein